MSCRMITSSVSLFGFNKFIFGFTVFGFINVKVCSPLQACFGNGANYHVVPLNH